MSGTQAAELLAQLARRITASLDLRETLQVVAQAVVDQLGFGAAVVNLVQPGDLCEVAAVAGPDEVGQALLGTRAPMENFRRLLAGCEPWGELRFLDHRNDDGLSRSVAGWTPPGGPSGETDAWHPEDILLAPLYAPGHTLIGVLSVDIPVDGRRPDLTRRRLLEQFAGHAALAIEHSRVHTLVADSEQLFRAMFDCSPIAIALMTETHEITRVNESCERLLGRGAADLVGRPAGELTPGDAENEGDQYEVHFTRPDGSEVWGRVNRTALAAGLRAGPQLVLTQIEDITLLRTMQAQFAHAATHDELTGLPNRALVLDRLTEVLLDAEKSKRRAAVLYCDVDHFKEINDTLGHAAGDQLLTEIGRNLASTARHRDIVGRFGGDEFVLVAYPMPSEAKATALADRVMRTVRRPVELRGEPVVASLSIGVALSGPDDTADSVLAAADQALYTAKAGGRGQWQLAGQLPLRGQPRGSLMGEEFRPVAPVDPTNLRPLLFLDVAHEIMLSPDWSHRAVTVVMESHTGPGRFSLYGANHPDTIGAVHDRRIDVSTVNPAAMLTMAYRGVGLYDQPRDVATIAVLPHDDRLGFAVADRLGFTSLDDIAAARYPLRVSVRGSIDACTPMMVDVVLKSHGFSLADLTGWGGEISYDQPMPNHPSRIGRLRDGELDAIFDEGVVMWADQVPAAGARLLPISPAQLDALEAEGFRRAVIEQSRYPSLPADVPALDYSGWPVYCRTDTPDQLVELFCQALVTRRDSIVWDIGGVQQPPLPLAQMVRDSPVTPLDVPLHARAEAVWQQHGFR